MRRWEIFVVALGFVPACSSDFADDTSRPVVDAGVDAPLIGDEPRPPEPDAESPAGDPCGDRSGLQPNAPWPMLGGCPKRAGYAPRAATFNTSIRWTADVAAEATSPVISADGQLWVGAADGRAYVLNAYTGGVINAVELGSNAVRSSAAIDARGLALFAYEDGNVIPARASTAFDAGAVPAAPNAGGPIVSSPNVSKDGAIVVATTDGKVAALRLGSTPKWTVVTGGDGIASPAIASSGRVYVSGAASTLHALDPETGAKIWDVAINAPLVGVAIGGDDTIYVAAADGKVHAVSADGKTRWTFAAGGALTGAPAVLAGILYVGSEDKKLHAVATADGAKKWEYATLGSVGPPTIAGDGTIYFGSTDGHVYALKASGLLYYAVNVKSPVKSPPAIGQDGTLYVSSAVSVVAIGP